MLWVWTSTPIPLPVPAVFLLLSLSAVLLVPWPVVHFQETQPRKPPAEEMMRPSQFGQGHPEHSGAFALSTVNCQLSLAGPAQDLHVLFYHTA